MYLKPLLINLFYLVLLGTAYAQQKEVLISEAGSPLIETYLMQDYNAHAQNHDIIQASDSRIYVANNDAVLRYDGLSWDVLFNTEPTAILESSSGKIFVGGPGVLGYFIPSDSIDITFHSIKETMLSETHDFGMVYTIYENNGKIYFIARFGILEYSQGKVKSYFTDVRFRSSFYKDENQLLIRNFSNNKVIEIKNGEVIERPLEEFGKSIGRSVIFQKFNDKWLLADGRNWTHWTKNGEMQDLPIAPLLYKKRIWGFDVLNDNLAVIRTYRDGIYLIDSLGNLINKIDTEDGIGQNLVFKSILDHQGNIWLACDKGISKVQGLNEASFFNKRGGSEQSVETIMRHNESLIVGRGLSVQKLNQNLDKSAFDEIANLVFPLTMISDQQRLLIASQRGLWSWTENDLNSLLETPCRAIVRSRYDTTLYYLGLLDGLALIEMNNGSIETFKKFKGISHQIRSIVELSKHELWVETSGHTPCKIEISEETDNEITVHEIRDENNEILLNGKPVPIDNQIVFTSEKGLYHYDNSSGKAIPYCKLGDKFCNGSTQVVSLAYDHYDHEYWLGCSNPNRIYRVHEKDGNHLIDSSFVLFTSQNEYHRTIFIEEDYIWAGGAAGVIRLNKKGYSKNGISSKLNSVQQEDGKLFYPINNPTLPHQEGALRFGVSSDYYISSDQVMYQYKLSPYDQNWSAWTYEPFRVYTQLPGGAYDFQFKSRSGKGDISSIVSSHFTIKKRFIETIWFKVLASFTVLILIGMSISFLKTRDQLLRDKQQKLMDDIRHEEKEKGYSSIINATEQERSRISKDLHDGIGQELSALKLSLYSVIRKSKDDDQKEELARIANSFSNSADEVRSISHQMMPRALMEQGLIPAIDDLLKNAFRHSETSFSLEESGVEGRFSERIEVSVYRIIQELVNNIIKHAEANQVSVQLISKGDSLLVFVEDDGKGFDSSNQKEGHGLINIKSRVEMINGSVNFEPSSPNGTFISLSIPIQQD